MGHARVRHTLDVIWCKPIDRQRRHAASFGFSQQRRHKSSWPLVVRKADVEASQRLGEALIVGPARHMHLAAVRVVERFHAAERQSANEAHDDLPVCSRRALNVVL